jgi:hypothetical protein
MHFAHSRMFGQAPAIQENADLDFEDGGGEEDRFDPFELGSGQWLFAGGDFGVAAEIKHKASGYAVEGAAAERRSPDDIAFDPEEVGGGGFGDFVAVIEEDGFVSTAGFGFGASEDVHDAAAGFAAGHL